MRLNAHHYETERATTAGTYTVNARYDNGTGAASSHSVSVNDRQQRPLTKQNIQ
jgi:hypothetical protein